MKPFSLTPSIQTTRVSPYSKQGLSFSALGITVCLRLWYIRLSGLIWSEYTLCNTPQGYTASSQRHLYLHLGRSPSCWSRTNTLALQSVFTLALRTRSNLEARYPFTPGWSGGNAEYGLSHYMHPKLTKSYMAQLVSMLCYPAWGQR